MVRRLLAVVLVVLGVPLLAAAPNVFYTKATVVVYPFSTNSANALDREAIARLATIIATEMSNTGKVNVTPAPPGTDRKEYLSTARAQHADFYISGYISPLGDGVSVVEQVVSTTSGIVVYSQTRQIATFADAAGQGDDLATFVSGYANRGLAQITAPPPPPRPSPEPSSGTEANLNKLFSHHRRAASTPAPSAKPAAAVANTAVATTAATPAQRTPCSPSRARPTPRFATQHGSA